LFPSTSRRRTPPRADLTYARLHVCWWPGVFCGVTLRPAVRCRVRHRPSGDHRAGGEPPTSPIAPSPGPSAPLAQAITVTRIRLFFPRARPSQLRYGGGSHNFRVLSCPVSHAFGRPGGGRELGRARVAHTTQPQGPRRARALLKSDHTTRAAASQLLPPTDRAPRP